jgi:hypothetical protein
MATGTRRVRHADPGAPRRGAWRKAGQVAAVTLAVAGGAAIVAVLLYGVADWAVLIARLF